MEEDRDRLHDVGEYMSAELFRGLLLNALTPDYDIVGYITS